MIFKKYASDEIIGYNLYYLNLTNISLHCSFFLKTAIQKEPKPTSRRPDIDILNIIVTWLILLYHVVIIYSPYLTYYVKDPDLPTTDPGLDSPYFYALVYIIFNNTWNMPLFFFLSGVSSYFSLKR